VGSLDGRVVLVTRPEEDVQSLADRLRGLGAEAIEAPTIEILPLDDPSELDMAVRDLAAGVFDWVSFTSPRAVDAVALRMAVQEVPPPVPAKVAAVGPATTHRLDELGIPVDLLAHPHTTEALADSFPPGVGRVLLPRADIAPRGLEQRLATKGWTPHRVTAYRTRVPDALPAAAVRPLAAGEVDAVCFTSASTVRGFVTMAGVVSGPRVVCIGPVTARAAEESGLRVDAIADPHTIDGLVAALERLLGGEAT
jgi:uroporphyrinogen-III synthase